MLYQMRKSTNIPYEYGCLVYVFVTCVATCNKWPGLNTPKQCYYKMNEIWEVAVVAIYFCVVSVSNLLRNI